MNKKLLKNIFFFIPLMLFSSGLTAKTNNETVWIAIEPFVLNSIQKNSQPLFEYQKIIHEKNETYFLVKESSIEKIATLVHFHLKHCGGFRVLYKNPSAEQNRKLSPPLPLLDLDYTINHEDTVMKWFPEISENYMNNVITHLSSYKTRYYKSPEGSLALKWIGSEWERLTKTRSDIKIEQYKYATHNQPTIILTIEGSVPSLKDQIIILGGHGDSININGNSENNHLTAPGADDNAAGIAVLSDILRLIVAHNYRPKHSIQFISYAAEEVGIQGSYELARVYREKRTNVIGVIQFDGVNFNSGRSFEMALISDSTDSKQNVFLAKLIDTYLQTKWSWEQCGYGCSDHAAWTYEGYSASYPIEAINIEQNPFIHTSIDTFDKSNYTSSHAALFVKLGIAYLIELDQ